jgi:hypothetical protein
MTREDQLPQGLHSSSINWQDSHHPIQLKRLLLKKLEEGIYVDKPPSRLKSGAFSRKNCG